MKICNNCSTANDLSNVKCGHCNMADNFSYPNIPSAAPRIGEPRISCRNCGCADPGSGSKCINCRFPLPAGTSLKHDRTDIPLQSNLKAS